MSASAPTKWKQPCSNVWTNWLENLKNTIENYAKKRRGALRSINGNSRGAHKPFSGAAKPRQYSPPPVKQIPGAGPVLSGDAGHEKSSLGAGPRLLSILHYEVD
jgi:hypothetical protein